MFPPASVLVAVVERQESGGEDGAVFGIGQDDDLAREGLGQQADFDADHAVVEPPKLEAQTRFGVPTHP